MLKLKKIIDIWNWPIETEWKIISGYFFYMIIGAIFLTFPFFQKNFTSFLDNLFVSVSAVSTTGLCTVSIYDNYNLFGQIIILVLIQLGGIGYMTLSSYLIITAGKRLESTRNDIHVLSFSTIYPEQTKLFIKKIVQFTFIFEFIGAVVLYIFFKNENATDPLWSAIFHSISSFCTAGFSIYNDSMMKYSHHYGINLTIAILSYAGGIGFIVWNDLWQRFRKRIYRISFTSEIILWVTLVLTILGTLQFFITEGSIHNNVFNELLIAFFQTMNAITTAGYNSVAMDKIQISTILFLSFLMFVGASPAGTGGGLKSTTFIANYALLKDKIRKYNKISLFGREIPEEKIYVAVCSIFFYLVIISISLFVMSYSENQKIEQLLFEIASAIGTVGLSTGITSSLTNFGKWMIIFNMFVGRVGIITFGYAIFFGNPGKQKPVAVNKDFIL